MTRVLIAAANNYDRVRYKKILVDLDLEVIDKPTTGPDALQIFRVLKPEMAIVDYLLPGMAGIDLLKTMKNDVDTSSILFLTPVTNKISIERAFRHRADDILIKPFSDEEFASTVLHLLSN